uniref:tripartite tricarboxylate transporter TctB family protein n=1 Tax=Halomonas sp. TaxID=1486246 RepID=UPI002637D3BC|nr:tripartite tricarboxylate transporter TctB family protein [Halomonas sp.]
MPSRWKDLLPGLLLLTMVAVLFAVTLQFDTVPAAFAQGMQSAAMPQLILVLITILTIVMIYQGHGHEEDKKAPMTWRFWATAAVLLSAAFLFKWLGITLTTALTCFALPLLWGERRITRVAIYSIATPLCIYLLFTHALQLRLPQGVLSPWLT